MLPVALVDISRLYFSNVALNGGTRKFDYRVLMDILSPEGGPCHAWTTISEGNEPQARFVDLLRSIGFSVHTEDVRKVLPIKGKFPQEQMKDLIRFDSQMSFLLGTLAISNDEFVIATDSVPMIPIISALARAGKKIRHVWLHEQLDTRWDNLFSGNENIIPDDLADYRKDLLGLYSPR